MIETVQKWLELRNELKELGVIGVSIWDEDILLSNEEFYDKFKKMEMKVQDDGSDYYPYRISVEVDGMKFFALSQRNELKEYFPELVKKDNYNANG